MAEDVNNAIGGGKKLLRQLLGVVLVYLLVPAILFGISRDVSWWQAWAFFLTVLIAGVGGRALGEHRHPGLMDERLHLDDGVKGWDKIMAPLMAVGILFPHVIVAGLDHLYGWTPAFPLWINILALVFIVLGYAIAVWAIAENRFFSALVRIQTDRGHVVCDSGPYSYIRHPGYAGNVLASFLIPFLLDSWWALIPAVIAFVISIVRTVLEDKTLINELPGYREYTSRLRYKLLPGIW